MVAGPPAGAAALAPDRSTRVRFCGPPARSRRGDLRTLGRAPPSSCTTKRKARPQPRASGCRRRKDTTPPGVSGPVSAASVSAVLGSADMPVVSRIDFQAANAADPAPCHQRAAPTSPSPPTRDRLFGHSQAVNVSHATWAARCWGQRLRPSRPQTAAAASGSRRPGHRSKRSGIARILPRRDDVQCRPAMTARPSSHRVACAVPCLARPSCGPRRNSGAATRPP